MTSNAFLNSSSTGAIVAAAFSHFAASSAFALSSAAALAAACAVLSVLRTWSAHCLKAVCAGVITSRRVFSSHGTQSRLRSAATTADLSVGSALAWAKTAFR